MADSVYLYLHRNPKTMEVFYVGIGVARRAYQHLQRSEFWKSYVHKYGKPIIEIAHSRLSWDQASTLEREYIAMFGRRDKGCGSLVNMTDGGEGTLGRTLSDDAKSRLRIARTGTVMSKDSRVKMSKSKTGLSYPKLKSRRPIALYDRTGKRIREYAVTRDVAKDGFNPNCASRMAHQKSIFKTKDRYFFVSVIDEVCPAYMAIRLELANMKRVFTSQAMSSLKASRKTNRDGLVAF